MGANGKPTTLNVNVLCDATSTAWFIVVYTDKLRLFFSQDQIMVLGGESG